MLGVFSHFNSSYLYLQLLEVVVYYFWVRIGTEQPSRMKPYYYRS